jgi:hypothetical protein
VRAVGRAEHGQGRLRGRDAQGGTGGDDHAVVGLDHQRRGTFGFDAQFALHHHQGFLVREAGDVEAAFETQAACAHAADALPGNFAHGGEGVGGAQRARMEWGGYGVPEARYNTNAAVISSPVSLGMGRIARPTPRCSCGPARIFASWPAPGPTACYP